MRKRTPAVFLAAALALSVGNAAAVPETLTNIAESSEVLLDLGAPSLDDSGTVGSGTILETVETDIVTGSDETITTVDDPGGILLDPGVPPVDDSGTEASDAIPDTGEVGSVTGSDGTTTTVDDPSGVVLDLGVPSLDASGTVAFDGSLDMGEVEAFETSIFTAPDPLANEAIGPGDMLFGPTVAGPSMFTESLNDSGGVGVARADPLVTPVPEPGTLPLLAAGMLGAVLWRKGKST